MHAARRPGLSVLRTFAGVIALVAFAASARAAVTPVRPAARKPAAHAATAPAHAAHAGATPAEATVKAAADSTMTLKGGEDGTVFRTLTVEGEDRIHFDVDRPELKLDLDPAKAPGLDWGTARDVLDRTTPDLYAPFLGASANERTPYVGHPWLDHFASGAVARFRPDVKGVERWKLSVANARGETVTTFEGHGDPPREIAWNGLSSTGEPVLPGLTYSYVFEAHDRAGNKRNFVGEGFGVSAWRLETPAGPVLAFSGAELRSLPATGRGDAPPPVVIEAASWLNQSEHPGQALKLFASARSADAANNLGQSVARWLGPMLIGGPSRLQVVAEARSDAPESGAVRISAAR
jgi:hypothetical protein